MWLGRPWSGTSSEATGRSCLRSESAEGVGDCRPGLGPRGAVCALGAGGPTGWGSRENQREGWAVHLPTWKENVPGRVEERGGCQGPGFKSSRFLPSCPCHQGCSFQVSTHPSARGWEGLCGPPAPGLTLHPLPTPQLWRRLLLLLQPHPGGDQALLHRV
jgi:hypothetical protein